MCNRICIHILKIWWCASHINNVHGMNRRGRKNMLENCFFVAMNCRPRIICCVLSDMAATENRAELNLSLFIQMKLVIKWSLNSNKKCIVIDYFNGWNFFAFCLREKCTKKIVVESSVKNVFFIISHNLHNM